jgi:hypothetical protein
MKHRIFMAITAILALIVGLAFAVSPAQLLSIYGITLDPDGEWIARCLGSAFLGVAVATWSARNAPQGDALRAVLLGDFVLSVTGLVIAILFSIRGSGNALIWSTTAIYVFLTAGFGYFRFVQPKSS